MAVLKRQFIPVPDESWMAGAVAAVAEERAAYRRLQPHRMPSFWAATALIPVVAWLLAVAAGM